MLPRVLEPEAMDTPDEARDYDAMDHEAVNARFVADFLDAHGPCRGGEILDVGTGPARIPIALCRADGKARVLGVDLAMQMLATAGRNIEEAGLAGRIRLATGRRQAPGGRRRRVSRRSSPTRSSTTSPTPRRRWPRWPGSSRPAAR